MLKYIKAGKARLVIFNVLPGNNGETHAACISTKGKSPEEPLGSFGASGSLRVGRQGPPLKKSKRDSHHSAVQSQNSDSII